MRNEQHHNPKKYLNNRISQSVKSISRNVRNAVREEIQAYQKNEKVTEVKKSSNGVKWTDVAMVIITGVLAYYTWQLFNTANTQTKQSIKMSEIAFAQDSISKLVYRRDSFNNILSKIKDSLNGIASKKRDSITFSQQRKSINAQIDEIKEAQRQFEKTSEPFLQVTSYSITNFEVGKKMIISYEVSNFGIYPLVILEGKTGSSTRVNPPPFDDIDKEKAPFDTTINHYVDRVNPFIVSTEEPLLNESKYQSLLHGAIYVYFWGYLKYQNVVTKHKKIYKFMIRFVPPTPLYNNLIFTSNEEVKE